MKYQLTKQNPDGSVSHHNFNSHHELQVHLMAMFNYTDGYKILSICIIGLDS